MHFLGLSIFCKISSTVLALSLVILESYLITHAWLKLCSPERPVDKHLPCFQECRGQVVCPVPFLLPQVWVGILVCLFFSPFTSHTDVDVFWFPESKLPLFILLYFSGVRLYSYSFGVR